MAWIALAAYGVGQGVSAAGSYYGAKASKVNPNKLNATIPYDPYSDPILSALSLEALVELGVDPTKDRRLGPFSQLLSGVSAGKANVTLKGLRKFNAVLPRFHEILENGFASGATDEEIALQLEQLAHPSVTNENVNKTFYQSVSGSGFRSVADLVSAERAYRKKTEELSDLAQIISSSRREQLDDFYRAAAAFEPLAPGSFEDAQSQTRDRILQDIDRQAQEANARILQQANQAGYNPAAALGRIEEERSRLSRSSDIDSIALAAALLEGRSIAQTSQLNALYAGLLPGQRLASLITGQTVPAGTTAGQLQSGNANSISALLAQNAAAEGAGTAGAFQAGADALNLFALTKLFGGGSPGAKPVTAGLGYNPSSNTTFHPTKSGYVY